MYTFKCGEGHMFNVCVCGIRREECRASIRQEAKHVEALHIVSHLLNLNKLR